MLFDVGSNSACTRTAIAKQSRLTHALGYRYRLHAPDLPGKPDIVFRTRRKVIFVHGCFWHLHPKAGCLDARLPKSNKGYWLPKLRRNVERDAQHLKELSRAGWKHLVIWECETKKTAKLRNRLETFLRT